MALAAHRRALDEDGDTCEANQEADAAHAALTAAMQADPRTVERVAGRLQTTRDPLEAEVLAALLGQFADPAVEQAALELAAKSADPALRVVGFDLLDALDLPSARPVALAALDREVDTDVRRAALHALPPPDGASIDEAVEVVSRLVRVVAQDADPETRRRAARVLGDWSPAPEALEGLVAALRRDAAPEVRAGAAFGLELARTADPRARAALVAALEDEDELVRENAWRALGAAAPLNRAEHAAWVAYRDARESLGY
ncbi:MAG: HEAT repeat domain-containing protein [Planctomycetes bacterium]|nr:HEAT repeat domain-containing protein [Planctomycetota bacterium]